MSDEMCFSSHFGHAEALRGRTWALPEAEGAEDEPDGGAGLVLDVPLVGEALADQHRVHESNQAAHDKARGLGRIDGAELARLDPVTDDDFDGVADHFLVRLDRVPAVL